MQAYIAQMIFMTAPLFAAIANRVALKQPTPYGLWPTVFLTIAGAVLVVVGQLQQNSEETGADTPSTGKLILGCCLALLSTLLLTTYFVLIQVCCGWHPAPRSLPAPVQACPVQAPAAAGLATVAAPYGQRSPACRGQTPLACFCLNANLEASALPTKHHPFVPPCAGHPPPGQRRGGAVGQPQCGPAAFHPPLAHRRRHRLVLGGGAVWRGLGRAGLRG